MFVDGNKINDQELNDDFIFLPCSLSVIAVLCININKSGTFIAKSYNSISDKLVTDDTWLVYNSSQDLTDNWYSIAYNDRSWSPAYTFFPYTLTYSTWASDCAIPELSVNDTFWFANQNPVDSTDGNTVNMKVYYRYKITSKCTCTHY